MRKVDRRFSIWACLLVLLSLTLNVRPYLLSALATLPTAATGPGKEYEAAIEIIEKFISHEMPDKALPAFSIALVDDQQIVWSKGFGLADPEKKIPATPDTIYRVGSVSKLFTDIAIMQLVEQGKLDLDASVTGYLPEFRPRNPFNKPITLRQLMSHRSGLVREPPIGNYFDPNQPSLAQTIASLNTTSLVYAPEAHTKYSNAAIATAGYVLERMQGMVFAECLKRAVLDPLGLQHSSFELTPQISQSLAKGYMWTIDGRVFEAPTFQLGMSPAGSMYTTVTDLAHFLSSLFAGGQGSKGFILKPETLQQMWIPQFETQGTKTGFGIGFYVSELDGHRMIGHGGAIYGFATQLSALPDDKLGVIAVTTKDCANAVASRVAEASLRAMLAVRQKRPIPQPEVNQPVDAVLALRWAGRYIRGSSGLDLIERSSALFLLQSRGGYLSRLRSNGEALVVDDRHAYGKRILPQADQVIFGDEAYKRVALEKPLPLAAKWKGLIGEYGWDHDILYVLERDGKLWALIEWFEFDPLEQVSDNVFKFPAYGLYDGEQLIFSCDAKGRAVQVEAANVVFHRRKVGPEKDAQQLHVKPLTPVTRLARQALSTQPPKEARAFRTPDLVELITLDPAIRLDIRYATNNNFLGTVFYRHARAFMQRPAAESLVRAHRKLKDQGYGLLIYDAYRPWYVTKIFWDATPDDKKIFVANPAEGSRHNRGAAVDLTLYDLKTGSPVEMVGTYDETTDRSYPDYPGGTSLQRWHRKLLRDAMESEGFAVYVAEWWHFDYKDWREYPIGNIAFEKIAPNRPTH